MVYIGPSLQGITSGLEHGGARGRSYIVTSGSGDGEVRGRSWETAQCTYNDYYRYYYYYYY